MPQEPETTVAAIITDKDSSGTKVLLTQRGPEDEHFPDRWCLPGGHIKPGELWTEAIHREVEQETNLDFRGRYFGSFDELVPEYDFHHVVKVYEGCGIGDPEIKPPEVVELKWVPLEEACTWPLAFRHNGILDAYATRELAPDRREELLAEYEALRAEALKRLDLRHHSLTLAITAVGIFIAAVFSELFFPAVLMFYPLVALCIAIAWTHNDMRIGQIGSHVKETIEQQLPEVKWEHLLKERYGRLPEVHRRFTEWTAVGVFLGTDGLAIASALILEFVLDSSSPGPQLAPQGLHAIYIGVGILDAIAMLLTYWLVHLRRKAYRRKQ